MTNLYKNTETRTKQNHIKTEKERARLIPINPESLLANNIFFKANTLYQWHSRKQHTELFVKIGRKIFINLDAWHALEQKAIEESQKEVLKVKKERNIEKIINKMKEV